VTAATACFMHWPTPHAETSFCRCVRGGPSVSRLAEEYPMSFAAVQKHVAVLERAGMVVKERRGREQLVRTDPDAVARARRVLDAIERVWEVWADARQLECWWGRRRSRRSWRSTTRPPAVRSATS
jgi:hypothetical protein